MQWTKHVFSGVSAPAWRRHTYRRHIAQCQKHLIKQQQQEPSHQYRRSINTHQITTMAQKNLLQPNSNHPGTQAFRQKESKQDDIWLCVLCDKDVTENQREAHLVGRAHIQIRKMMQNQRDGKDHGELETDTLAVPGRTYYCQLCEIPWPKNVDRNEPRRHLQGQDHATAVRKQWEAFQTNRVYVALQPRVMPNGTLEQNFFKESELAKVQVNPPKIVFGKSGAAKAGKHMRPSQAIGPVSARRIQGGGNVIAKTPKRTRNFAAKSDETKGTDLKRDVSRKRKAIEDDPAAALGWGKKVRTVEYEAEAEANEETLSKGKGDATGRDELLTTQNGKKIGEVRFKEVEWVELE